MRVKLYRFYTGEEGTFGIVTFGGRFWYTGELPWHRNERNISCIPEGEYPLIVRESPKYGKVYEVAGVPGRSYILFHQGNFCGDKTRGYRSNVQGCILLGSRKGKLWGQEAVLASRTARAQFESELGFDSYILEVHNVGFTF